ncbi:MAG: response regulator transcription factor [Chloroflexi bacterium]|nr:response regulator transcription factor [Chloroflexota bacterium]
MRVLVVDDDTAILRLLNTNLKARAFDVITCCDGERALQMAEMEPFDLIILDIMMPKIDGVEVCRRIRSWSKIPIIMLSAKGDEDDKVKCLELGADDYVTKPFGIAELLARITTALRHAQSARVSVARANFVSGDMEINFASRQVTVGGQEVRLTATEFTLLQELAVNAGKVLTHHYILKRVWGEEYDSETEYIRVFIGRLRLKIEPDPTHPCHLITIPRVGYQLN